MESHTLKILKKYLSCEEEKLKVGYNTLSYEEKDEFRLKYDNDAKYYYEKLGESKEHALLADTIISFWTPYKRLLKIEAGWIAYKTPNSLKVLIQQIETYRKKAHTESIRKVNAKIENFSRVCYTKGNYMLLPSRQMNTKRYYILEDRIDATLYECFEKGRLSCFFRDDDELREWIKSQNLISIFKDNIIEKDNIMWFVENRKNISKMTDTEIYKYLENAVRFIEKRNG